MEACPKLFVLPSRPFCINVSREVNPVSLESTFVLYMSLVYIFVGRLLNKKYKKLQNERQGPKTKQKPNKERKTRDNPKTKKNPKKGLKTRDNPTQRRTTQHKENPIKGGKTRDNPPKGKKTIKGVKQGLKDQKKPNKGKENKG